MTKSKLFEWNILDKEVVHTHLFTYKILISNESRNGTNFYSCFNSILDIRYINQINFNNSIIGKLLYIKDELETDVSCESISYKNIFEILYKKSISFIKNKIKLKKEIGYLTIDKMNVFNLIQKFEQGNEIVNIVNNNCKWLFFIEKKAFYQNNFNLNLSNRCEINIEETDDNDLQEKIAQCMLKTMLKEIPILRNGRVNAIATRKNIAQLELQWDFIDQEQILKYFLPYKKIVISSRVCGFLKKFFLTHKSIINFEFLTSKNLKDVLNGMCDLLITNSDEWDSIGIKSISLNQIYIDLLSKILYEKMKEKKLNYLYFSRPIESKVKNVSKRWAYHDGTVVFPGSILKNGYYQVKDYNSILCNTMNGIRLTIDSPLNYINTIWFFGPCIVAGLNVADGDTMESQLQRMLNNKGYHYRVVNCGHHGLGEGKITDINILFRMTGVKFKEGDIILQFGSNVWNSGFVNKIGFYYDLSDFFNENNDKCFVNGWTSHLDKHGYNMLTNYIYKLICPMIKRDKESKDIKQQEFSLLSFGNNNVDDMMKREWDKYYSRIIQMLPKDLFNKKVGCIVMNGNPITIGHTYLIQESLRQVDYLIVFVVEEDKSYFSFSDRYNMIKIYCKNFPNIFVLPSGKCIISTETFGEYFDKEMMQNEIITPIKDVQIFAQIVAPQLNIKIRFVGDEPMDSLTRQYNRTLETILPLYGIQFNEIKRYEVDGEIISASKVRLMLKYKQFEKIKQYVPQTTLDYLLKLYREEEG